MAVLRIILCSQVLRMQPMPKARANKKKAEELKRQKEAQKESETVLVQWKAGLVDSRIPLKTLPPKAEAAALDQLHNCTSLSASDPLSCCMLTIPQVCPCHVYSPDTYLHGPSMAAMNDLSAVWFRTDEYSYVQARFCECS